MDYKISHEPPAIYEECRRRFGVSFAQTIFTVGNTIHSAKGISADVLEHELTHVAQQQDPEAWWEKYLADPTFRYEQELEAYRAQYRWIVQNAPDRNIVAKHLVFYAKALSGPMYGNLVNFSDAIKQIKC